VRVFVRRFQAGEPGGASDAARATAQDDHVTSKAQPPVRSEAELLDEVRRRVRAADAVLTGLADDMAAAGASTASERTQRARAELTAAQLLVEELRGRHT
jgi:hypothetical protein